MTSTPISGFSADTSISGSELLLVVDGSTEKNVTPDVLRNYANQTRLPAYVSGNWYTGWPVNATATSAALATNTTYCTPFRIWQNFTMSQLGGRVVAAGTNIQFGIYAHNSTTGRPTGSVLGKTASITASANTNVSAALAGGNTAFTPGVYWFCVAVDNAATTVLSGGTGAQVFGSIIGSATLGNILTSSGSQPCYGVSFSDTFGTWSSATGQTFTELTGANFNQVALPVFKVA